MGGCATKPKVSKGGDVGESPTSAPEPAKEEAVAVAASETNAVETSVALPETVEKKEEATATAVVVVREGGRGEHSEGVKEIVVEDDKVDVQVSKRRSLGLLFNKENEEKKSALGSENPSLEQEKPEELSATESSTKEPDMEGKSDETDESLAETEPEQKPAPATVAEAADKAEQETVVEVAEVIAIEKESEAEKAATDEQHIKA